MPLLLLVGWPGGRVAGCPVERAMVSTFADAVIFLHTL